MAYWSLPSFFSGAWVRGDGMTLGLDLQGGIHWLLRVDTDAAVQRELEKVASAVTDAASEQKIEGITTEAKGDTLVLHGDTAALRKLLDENAPQVDVDEQDGALVARLKERVKKDAIDRYGASAIEVLRRRVEGLGVREPIIAPQGGGRVLVQMPGVKDREAAGDVLKKTTFLEFKLVLDSAPSQELLLAKLKNGVPEDQMIITSKTRGGKEEEALLVPKKAVLKGDMLEDARMDFDRR